MVESLLGKPFLHDEFLYLPPFLRHLRFFAATVLISGLELGLPKTGPYPPHIALRVTVAIF
jgi:hypothetical protein